MSAQVPHRVLLVLSLVLFASAVAAAPVRFVWKGKDADVPGAALYQTGLLEYAVEPGKGTVSLPGAVIVLAENPTRSAQVAAAELNYYVQKITGQKLRVLTEACNPVKGGKILIGESSLTRSLGLKNADFADQEYLIRSYGDVLVLLGRDEEEYGPIDYEGEGLWPGFTRYYDWSRDHNFGTRLGSVYAVDTFLQKCAGVRWYMPGDLGEVCPPQKTIVVKDQDLRERPWTAHRSYWPNVPVEYFNYFGSGRPPTRMNSRDVMLWLLRMKVIGSEAFACNHSLIADWIKQRFPDKPELLAQGYEKPTQLCLSNPELLRIVVQDGKDYWDGKTNFERGAGDYFPVMPHDTSDYCQCSKCQALLAKGKTLTGMGFWSGTSSPYNWTFVNAVARELKKARPGLWVSCCAYAKYFMVPEGVKFEDNVAVEVCRVLIEGIQNPAARDFTREEMAKWAKTVKRWYVWEYFDHIQSNGMESSFPGVFLHEIAADARFLQANGCRGMFNEMNSGNGVVPNFAQDHLNVYAQMQLLCDTSVDVDQLLDEYCKLFYGPAAAPMKGFWVLNETQFTNPANWQLGPEDTDPNWDRICPPAVLKQFEAQIDEASKLATTEPYATRVRLMKEAVYGMMAKNCMKHFVLMKTAKRSLQVPLIAAGAPVPETETNHADKFFAINGDATTTRSEAWVARDADNIYVKVKCYEPEPEKIKAEVKTNKQVAVCADDSVELFFDPGHTRANYLQVLGNTIGATNDIKYVAGTPADHEWLSGVVTKIDKAPEAWTITFTVPIKNLTGGKPVAPGDVWGFNICRNRLHEGLSRTEYYSAWCPTGAGFHAPKRFGVLVFE